MTHAGPRLLIKNGTLIDGAGPESIPNALIAVDGNRISHVGPYVRRDARGNPR